MLESVHIGRKAIDLYVVLKKADWRWRDDCEGKGLYV